MRISEGRRNIGRIRFDRGVVCRWSSYSNYFTHRHVWFWFVFLGYKGLVFTWFLPSWNWCIVAPSLIMECFSTHRCKDWIQRIRREDLLKKDIKMFYCSGYFLCSDHFEDSHFMNVSEKKKLIWSAVPFIFKVPNPLPSVTSSRLPRTKDLIPEQQHPARREPT